MALRSIFKFSEFLKDFVQNSPGQEPKKIRARLLKEKGISVPVETIVGLQTASNT